MSDFYTERTIKKPRKQRRCDWCGELCLAGDPKIYCAGIWEGDFFTAHFHPECVTAKNQFIDGQDLCEPWPDQYSMQRGKAKEKGDAV